MEVTCFSKLSQFCTQTINSTNATSWSIVPNWE